VPIGALEPNPFQPRAAMDPASPRRAGRLDTRERHRPADPRAAAGGALRDRRRERRFRAAQALGLVTVPVTVRDVPDDQLLELALVENIQREELNPIEEAQAFHRLQEELRLTQEDIARRVGRDRATVANALRLLRLPRDLREMVSAGRLSAGHARALLALERADEQVALGHEAARKGLSVREVERRVALRRAPRGSAPSRRTDPNTRAAEERLRTALGTRVEIARRGRGGQIRVRFDGEAELNRLFELLVRAGRGR
jgi:ParB family transcriptional regulator, chromosome partitioning protein